MFLSTELIFLSFIVLGYGGFTVLLVLTPIYLFFQFVYVGQCFAPTPDQTLQNLYDVSRSCYLRNRKHYHVSIKF